MGDFAVIIPAIINNKYHKKGDLAPFGNTTLLQWKISQCKEFCSEKYIFVASNNSEIKNIALAENIGFILRDDNMICYFDMIKKLCERISANNIILTHCSAPFIDSRIYDAMYRYYIDNNISLLAAGKSMQEYLIFNDKKINFENNFSNRNEIGKVKLVMNGCYIFNKDKLLKNDMLLKETIEVFELDEFSALEVKNINEYIVARELIDVYFRKKLKVKHV
ncbi:hypothetical protein L8W51_07895 [Campylobacter lari]|nr:hypothetical protein [Campylobacter lari]